MSESNIMKKDTLSLSGSNSSFRKKYGELLNVKEKNFLQLSTEKSKLKSAAFDDNNKAVINKCRSVKKKNKGKKQNKLQLDLFGSNINEKINEKSMNQSKTKEKNKAKVSPSPLKRKRHTIFKSIHNIKLEENSNIESNIHSNYNNYNQKKVNLVLRFKIRKKMEKGKEIVKYIPQNLL
jgi:hypothetical protein